jgi:hypothetical protein
MKAWIASEHATAIGSEAGPWRLSARRKTYVRPAFETG